MIGGKKFVGYAQTHIMSLAMPASVIGPIN